MRRFRPHLEALEGREVPAVFTWTGAAGPYFDTPGSWLGQDFPPGQEHDLPAAGDDLVFQNMPFFGGSADCLDAHGDPAGPYRSVGFGSNYTGRVTLSGGFETEAFTVAGGTIDQPTSGTDSTEEQT